MGRIKPESLRHVADPTSVQVMFPELMFNRGAVSPKSSWTLYGQAQIIRAALGLCKRQHCTSLPDQQEWEEKAISEGVTKRQENA